MTRQLTTSQRFWAKVDKSATCWEWIAGRDKDGYGSFYLNGKQRRAHRVAYELEGIEIPADLEVDHLCFNRACVNPAHLEPVTHRENMRRRVAIKTHCKHGHEYTPENSYIYETPGGQTRYCRQCTNANQRRTQERKRSLTRETA